MNALDAQQLAQLQQMLGGLVAVWPHVRRSLRNVSQTAESISQLPTWLLALAHTDELRQLAAGVRREIDRLQPAPWIEQLDAGGRRDHAAGPIAGEIPTPAAAAAPAGDRPAGALSAAAGVEPCSPRCAIVQRCAGCRI